MGNKSEHNYIGSPKKENRFKVNFIRLCLLIITVAVVYFCYFLIILLININERVTGIDQNLQILKDRLEKTSDDVDNTKKKIENSWLLSW